VPEVLVPTAVLVVSEEPEATAVPEESVVLELPEELAMPVAWWDTIQLVLFNLIHMQILMSSLLAEVQAMEAQEVPEAREHWVA
jgi:hypothetical protein